MRTTFNGEGDRGSSWGFRPNTEKKSSERPVVLWNDRHQSKTRLMMNTKSGSLCLSGFCDENLWRNWSIGHIKRLWTTSQGISPATNRAFSWFILWCCSWSKKHEISLQNSTRCRHGRWLNHLSCCNWCQKTEGWFRHHLLMPELSLKNSIFEAGIFKLLGPTADKSHKQRIGC